MQISQKSTCIGVSFVKKRLQQRRFSVKFAKFWRTFFTEHLRWLPLPNLILVFFVSWFYEVWEIYKFYKSLVKDFILDKSFFLKAWHILRDSKWTQTGLKSQTTLKSRFVYMAISLHATLRSSNPFQKLFGLNGDFTAVTFETVVRF